MTLQLCSCIGVPFKVDGEYIDHIFWFLLQALILFCELWYVQLWNLSLTEWPNYHGYYWESIVYVDRYHLHLHGVVFRWIRRNWAPQRNPGLRSSQSLCPGGAMRRTRTVTLERSKGTGIWRWAFENGRNWIIYDVTKLVLLNWVMYLLFYLGILLFIQIKIH